MIQESPTRYFQNSPSFDRASIGATRSYRNFSIRFLAVLSSFSRSRAADGANSIGHSIAFDQLFEGNEFLAASAAFDQPLSGDRQILDIVDLFQQRLLHDVGLAASRKRRELLEAGFQFWGQFESEHVAVPRSAPYSTIRSSREIPRKAIEKDHADAPQRYRPSRPRDGNRKIRRLSAACPHRGPLPARKPRSRARNGGRAEGDGGATRDRPRLQDLVRQGQPHLERRRAGPRPGSGPADLRGNSRNARPARADGRPRARAMRDRGAGGRRGANPRLPVPPDRSPDRGGAHGSGGQRQEGAVPGALGHAACGGENRQRRRRGRAGDRARRQLRLQYARLRHARAADSAGDRRAGDFRCDSLGAAAG